MLANAAFDVGRVDDHAGGVPQHLIGERELVCASFPDRRQEPVDDAVSEHPPDRAGFPLHRVEVPLVVLAAEGQPGDEVVQDEVVQHDDSRTLAQSLNDPPVVIGVVADVIQRQVRASRCTPPRASDHGDLDPSREQHVQQRHPHPVHVGFFMQRRYILNVPTNYDNTHPYRLIIAYHELQR